MLTKLKEENKINLKVRKEKIKSILYPHLNFEAKDELKNLKVN